MSPSVRLLTLNKKSHIPFQCSAFISWEYNLIVDVFFPLGFIPGKDFIFFYWHVEKALRFRAKEQMFQLDPRQPLQPQFRPYSVKKINMFRLCSDRQLIFLIRLGVGVLQEKV